MSLKDCVKLALIGWSGESEGRRKGVGWQRQREERGIAPHVYCEDDSHCMGI